MGAIVRTATAADKAQALELLSALSAATGSNSSDIAAATFDDLLSNARGLVLVAEDDGEVLGLASLSFNLAMRYGGEYCQLEELVVSPAARGKQLGALLMHEAVAQAKARGCAEFGLYLVETTEHNRPFYEKFGFNAVGTEMRQALI